MAGRSTAMASIRSLRRKRLVHAVLTLIVIIAGLSSRQFPGLFPVALGKYPGDALWALMVFLLFGMAMPKASSARLAVLALGVSFFVEFSQLWQGSWINSVRHTRIGHLVLGSAFGWYDLIAYSAGVLVGYTAEMVSGFLISLFRAKR